MFKKYFWEKAVRRYLAHPVSRRIPFESGLLLVDERTAPEAASLADRLSARTGIPRARWDILKVDRKNNGPSHIPAVIPAHFNWKGEPRDPAVRPFFEKTYDLLVDLTALETLFNRLVSAAVRAGFRAGNRPDRTACFDLVIDAPPGEAFATELAKYLRAMGFIRP
ncbi:MAG: hypothetical protein GXO27_01725 [Chlorobi bacterium]|nr:hypothetical protein [Chlorobiota bacterium]